MTDLTRIACPGCRRPLLFKPEALDFPATCAACECRFSVGIYLRLSCPKCHQGSKIRESYRRRRVRCIRCNHNFVSDEGIAAGAEGRLLVARMLDADSPTPPETVQPFLPSAPPEQTTQDPDVGPATVSGSGIWQISRALEIERLRAEVEELRARHECEVSSARSAAREAEAKLVEAVLELGETEQRTARLLSECDEALHASNLERSALLSRLDRLNAAVASAVAGQSEAERLTEEVLRKLDAATDDLRVECRKRLELGRVADQWKAEIETARGAEAAREAARIELERSKHEAEERAGSLLGEARKLAGEVETLGAENARLLEENGQLAGLVERLRGENRAIGEADRIRQENRRLRVAIEQARREAESLHAKLALEVERADGESGPLREDGGCPGPGHEPFDLDNGRLPEEARITHDPRIARALVRAESPD